MDKKQITEFIQKYKRLNEQAVVYTPQLVRDVINAITLDNTELEEDEKIKEETLSTIYNEYKMYGLEYDDKYIIPMGDFKNYIKDLADEFTTVLPDGFEQFFNTEALQSFMEKDNYYTVQAINLINQVKDTDYYKYEKVDQGTVDGIDYVVLREII